MRARVPRNNPSIIPMKTRNNQSNADETILNQSITRRSFVKRGAVASAATVFGGTCIILNKQEALAQFGLGSDKGHVGSYQITWTGSPIEVPMPLATETTTDLTDIQIPFDYLSGLLVKIAPDSETNWNIVEGPNVYCTYPARWQFYVPPRVTNSPIPRPGFPGQVIPNPNSPEVVFRNGRYYILFKGNASWTVEMGCCATLV